MQSQRDRRHLQLAKFTFGHEVEAILLISREGTVRDANEAAAKLTEWPIHEVRKRPVRDLFSEAKEHCKRGVWRGNGSGAEFRMFFSVGTGSRTGARLVCPSYFGVTIN